MYLYFRVKRVDIFLSKNKKRGDFKIKWEDNAIQFSYFKEWECK
jgi:hypothetical protein